jgi:hypothetical protein
LKENYTKHKLAVASFVKSFAVYVASCWLLSACFLVAVWMLLVASDCFWLLLVVFACYGAQFETVRMLEIVQTVAQAIFEPLILSIRWFNPYHSWFKKTRRPQQRDRNVLSTSFGGSKLPDVQNYGMRFIFDPRLRGTYSETNIFELRVNPIS